MESFPRSNRANSKGSFSGLHLRPRSFRHPIFLALIIKGLTAINLAHCLLKLVGIW